MADENATDEAIENKMNPDNPIPENIDDLLNEAGNALDDLEAQLNDDTDSASIEGASEASSQESSDLSDADANVDNVDDTLASLEDELLNLSEELNEGSKSGEVAESTEPTAEQMNALESDPDLQSALEDLGNELDNLNESSSDETKAEGSDDSAQAEAPEVADADAALEDADDIVNAALNEVEQAEPEPQASNSDSDNEIENMLADFADELNSSSGEDSANQPVVDDIVVDEKEAAPKVDEVIESPAPVEESSGDQSPDDIASLLEEYSDTADEAPAEEIEAVTPDESPEPAVPESAVSETPEAVEAPEAPVDSDDIDDVLASLAEEIEDSGDVSVEPEQSEPVVQEQDVTPVENVKPDESLENIDDALADIADDIATSEESEQAVVDDLVEEPEVPIEVPDETAAVIDADAVAGIGGAVKSESGGDGIDDALADMTEDIDQLNDDISSQVKSADDALAPEPQAAEASEPSEESQGQDIDELLNQAQDSLDGELAEAPEIEAEEPISEDDAMVLDELEETVQGGTATDQQDSQDEQEYDGEYSHFSLPKKAVVKSFETANKPFGFVGDGVKDIMGIVAVVTLLISMVTAAVALLVKG